MHHAATVPAHSAAVTGLAFTRDDAKLLSCGADASLVVSRVWCGESSPVDDAMRTAGVSAASISSMPKSCSEDAISRIAGAVRASAPSSGVLSAEAARSARAPFGTLHAVDVDATNRNAVTAGEDARVRVWRVKDAAFQRAMKPDGSGEGGQSNAALTRVALDPSGLFVAVASMDRVVRLYDFHTEQCLARVSAHAEVITSLVFTHDCRRLVSTDAAGCFMVWRLSPSIRDVMAARRREVEEARGHAMLQRAMKIVAPMRQARAAAVLREVMGSGSAGEMIQGSPSPGETA